MSAEIIKSEPQNPDPAVVVRAAQVLAAGHLLIFPTDTVYGLACRADDEEAVRKLFAAKRRPQEKALPILVANIQALEALSVTMQLPPKARRMAQALWPGPLTIVVQKAATIPDIVTGGQNSVGVRVPDLPLTRRILATCCFPVATTSANISDEPPARDVEDLPAELKEAVALIVDGGLCPGGQPSTVVDITKDPPQILRKGPISEEAIFHIWNVEEGEGTFERG